MHEHHINGIKQITAFALAGNAYFTLRNASRGTRLTFRFNKPKQKRTDATAPVFASVLSGPENTNDYQFVGTFFQSDKQITYRHGARSRVGTGAPSARTIAWLAQHMITQRELPPEVEFYHAGRCGRCGKMLTVPESITTGLGPVCEGLS
jgi:hypothetical protein